MTATPPDASRCRPTSPRRATAANLSAGCSRGERRRRAHRRSETAANAAANAPHGRRCSRLASAQPKTPWPNPRRPTMQPRLQADVAPVQPTRRRRAPVAGCRNLSAVGFLARRRAERRVPIDTSILEQLPVPVLIHSGDALHYANREFLELTGYDTVDELQAAGGLGELFGEPYPPEQGDGRATAASSGCAPARASNIRSKPSCSRCRGAAARRCSCRCAAAGASRSAIPSPRRRRSPIPISRRASPRCGRSSTRRPTASC